LPIAGIAAMTAAKEKYQAQIDAVIASARKSGSTESVEAPDGAEIYGYPLSKTHIAWGINDAETGFPIARDIWRRPSIIKYLRNVIRSFLTFLKRVGGIAVLAPVRVFVRFKDFVSKRIFPG